MTTNTENCEEKRKPYDRTRLWGLLALLALLLLCCLLGPTLIPGVVPTATPVAVVPTAVAVTATAAPTAVKPTEASIAAPTANAEVKDGGLTLTGTGTPGSKLQIVINDQPVGEATVGPDGTWTFNTSLEPGDYKIDVNALDVDGNVTVSAPALNVNVTAALTAPSITPLDNNLTAGVITLTGLGTPGSKVQIVVDGQPVGEAEVGPDGTWSFPTELTAGPHKVEVNALDDAGKVTASAKPVDLTLGEGTSTAPSPTLDLPGGALYTGPQTLTGTGVPGSKVQIVIGDTPAGEATVGADGKWSFDAEFPSAGDVPVVVNALGAAGNISASSETAILNFSALTLDALAASYAPGPITLGGSGIPGSKVQIVVDGQPVGEAEVGADGKWSFPYNFIQAGNFSVVVNGLDAGGQVVAATEPATARIKAPAANVDIKRICDFSDPTVFGEDKGKFWLVDRCDTLTYIARRTNIALAALIAANPQVKNPDLIYPGWEIVLPGR